MFETKRDIESWLRKNRVDNFTVNDYLTVDVSGSVDLRNQGLNEIPVQFGEVHGDFDCRSNYLNSLHGAPHTVAGDFYCAENQLDSLRGGPAVVRGDYYCSYNQISSLCGSPKTVGRNFIFNSNNLKTLDHLPIYIGGNAKFWNNPLKDLGSIDSTINGFFLSPPIAELSSVADIDDDGDYRVNSENFNAKVKELKSIREEKALFESSIAKVLDTQPLGELTRQAAEPQPQQRAKPKFKL